MEFLTVYKKLDNLCKDLLNTDRGISTYISIMEDKSSAAYFIQNWSDDYKALKHYRWVRNQLAHEDNVYEEDLCTEADIQWIIRFHKRILNHQDPLALYNKTKRKVKTPIKPVQTTIIKKKDSKSFFQKLFSIFHK